MSTTLFIVFTVILMSLLLWSLLGFLILLKDKHTYNTSTLYFLTSLAIIAIQILNWHAYSNGVKEVYIDIIEINTGEVFTVEKTKNWVSNAKNNNNCNKLTVDTYHNDKPIKINCKVIDNKYAIPIDTLFIIEKNN